MIKTEYLIIGQGISGTFLSWYLRKSGHSFMMIDDGNRFSSSRVAAGVINPVTGRRIVKTWMIETLIPFALTAYHEIAADLNTTAILPKRIIDFFPSAQMLLAFRERAAEETEYLSLPNDAAVYAEHFKYDLGFGEIHHGYMVQLQALLSAWRRRLLDESGLREERYQSDELTVKTDGVRYRDIEAEKVIFCDGIHAAESKWFHNLPFAVNKGEALIVSCPTLPDDAIFKKGIMLAPMGEGLFWAGSSHEWKFVDTLPSKVFYERTKAHLEQWLQHPFSIEQHLASVRPATIERRPFVGLHPHFPAVGILNGMGTKGCSLAPYFAHQLVNHLTKNSPILPEASVHRFTRVLQSSR